MEYFSEFRLHTWTLINSGKTFFDKKVLIVAGDSFTNNAYMPSIEQHWSYIVGNKLNYDFVFNIATSYGSNEEIFNNCVSTFTNENPHAIYNESIVDKFYLSSYFEIKNIDVVIIWSTPIRDKSSISLFYQPFKISTIPDIEANTPNVSIFKKYYEDWFRYEYHSYKTQLYILMLQEYLKIHQINYNFFMGFTPLVNKEFENSKWDLRKYIDEERFYGLHNFPYNLQDYLAKKVNDNFNSNIPISELYFFGPAFKKLKNIFDNTFKNFDEYDNRKKIINSASTPGTYDNIFVDDGHPAKLGLELIAELITIKIIKTKIE